MKKASVRELRNHYTDVLGWIDAGEDVLITRRGKIIARLSPETDESAGKVDWKDSPEVSRDRSEEPCLSAEDTASVLKESSGRW